MNTAEQYGAIAAGTGISGGRAVKRPGENGLKTSVLERVRTVRYVEDHPTMNDGLRNYSLKGELSVGKRKNTMRNQV